MQYLSISFKSWLIYMAKFLRNSYPADCSLPCAPVAETCRIASMKRKSLLEPYSCGGVTTVEWNWHAMLEPWKPQHARTHAHTCVCVCVCVCSVCTRERERELWTTFSIEARCLSLRWVRGACFNIIQLKCLLGSLLATQRKGQD